MKGSRDHVLVVDNDRDFLITIECLLENQGLDTTITWDMKEALDLLASQQFEIVLVGHHPPELDASEILPLLRQAPKSPPCLVLQPTSRMSPINRVFLSQGASAVLCKWHYDEIAEHVRKCLAQALDKDKDADKDNDCRSGDGKPCNQAA